VWATITGVANYPAWRSGLDSVSIDAGGSTLRWREASGRDHLSFEAERMDSPAVFVSRITDRDIPFGGSWTYRLSPENAGTRVTITENGEVYNPLLRFMSRYIIGHTAALDAWLVDLSRRHGPAHAAGGE
jgi:hypothetical protein